MIRLKIYFFSVICFFITICNGGITNNRIDNFRECILSSKLKQEIKSYEVVANRIMDEIINGKFKGHTYELLAKFIDTFGSRLAGTQNLENSIDYMMELSKNFSLTNIRTEEVTVPAWRRGPANLRMISPVNRNISVLALGGSVAGNFIAEAIVVSSFKDFDKLSEEEVRDKIVIFNPVFTSYGETVQYRSKGASTASAKGAKAVLIRSITPKSIRSLHTGMQSYRNDVKKIPAASISLEDSDMFHRIYSRGEKLLLELNIDTSLSEGTSRNTFVDLVGKEPNISRPIVVVSGHIDSWDIGDGAMDDGGGVMVSLASLHFMKELGLIPRRTMRAIFWTAEEEGLLGAEAHVKAHKDEENLINFAMESDMGTFKPRGLDFSGSHEAGCIIQEILKLLSPINATEFKSPMDGGPDIVFWAEDGIPSSSLLNANGEYFWYHHSVGDSMLVEDPHNLDLCAAVWTVVSYVVADLESPLPRAGEI